MENRKPGTGSSSKKDKTQKRQIPMRSTNHLLEVNRVDDNLDEELIYDEPEGRDLRGAPNDTFEDPPAVLVEAPVEVALAPAPQSGSQSASANQAVEIVPKGRSTRRLVRNDSQEGPSTAGNDRGKIIVQATPTKRRASGGSKRNCSKKRNKRSEDSEDEDGDSDEETFNTYGTKLKKLYKDKFIERSCEWITQKKLAFARDSDRVVNGNFSAKQRSNVNKFIVKLQGNEDTIFPTMPVTLATKYPDDGDYRYSTDYLEKQTLTTASLPNNPKEKNTGKINPTDIPQIKLTGSLYLQFDCKAEDVIKAGAQFLDYGINAISKPHELTLNKPSSKLLEEEKKAFDKYRKELKGDQKTKMPCPLFDPKSAEELHSPEFEKLVNAAPITLINNLGKTLGMELELFTIEAIVGRAPDSQIDILNQIPQSADNNYTSKGARSWRTKLIHSSMTMADFLAYVQSMKESSFEAYQIVADNHHGFERKLKSKLNRQMEEYDVPEEEDAAFPWIKFGTNVDMLKETYKDQFKNVMDKFPEFLRPKSKNNLLDYCGCVVLGVNTVQIYLKVPGVRTAAHVENSLMSSINWNLGPGTSIWICVPYEYWGVVDELCTEEGQKFNHQNYWPSEAVLKERGIPYYKLEQKKDQCVYLNTGTIHWVQSNGFCVQASWNVGQSTFTQLATSMVSYDFNLKNSYQQHVPLVSMAWNLARNKKFLGDERMYNLTRSIMIRSLGYNKRYFDVLQHQKVKLEKLNQPMNERVFRCAICNCEVFNLIKWYMSNREDVESYSICSRCNVKDEWKEGRTLKYTYFDSLEQLCAEFDSYVPNRSIRHQ